jgi:two-component system, OmpR family, sensor histidine kinase BaeS
VTGGAGAPSGVDGVAQAASGGRRAAPVDGRRPRGIALRLLAAAVLVVLAGGVAGWVVAAVIGPTVFHEHLHRAEETPGSMAQHAQEAFASASQVTLAVALGTSVVVSLGVSVFQARRIRSALGAMAASAGQVAAGGRDVRVPEPGMGREFSDLATALNGMAARLDQDAAMRRRLTDDVAHELRTPVATITAYLDAVEDGVQELSPETVEVLREQAARLTRLASDLAAVTRAENDGVALATTPTRPDALVAAAGRAAQEGFAERGVALEAGADVGLPTVDVDPVRLGQVLANLLDNALRHTPPGGSVRLEASRAGEHVRFVVADTGDGIDAEHLPHVFERFYRVDAARDRGSGGSGIGLAVVRALVEAHGGTVVAESAGRGTGARFVVDLPPPSAGA